jgi:hypothetical protein
MSSGFDAGTVARFWSRVDTSAGPEACWTWRGRAHPYGAFDALGRGFRSHRVAYELSTGKDPGDLLVCHSCDNPPCCNPNHLFVGTHLDNNRDRDAKGRAAPITRATNEQMSHGDEHYSRTQPERLARGKRHGSRTQPQNVPRGERNGRAKLTTEAVLSVRRDRESGMILVRIAEKYGVSFSAAQSVVAGKRWAHVT